MESHGGVGLAQEGLAGCVDMQECQAQGWDVPEGRLLHKPKPPLVPGTFEQRLVLGKITY